VIAVAELREQHRRIEALLDALLRALTDRAQDWGPLLTRAAELAHAHYDLEEREFFAVTCREFDQLTRKMSEQHDEARELAEAATGGPDGERIARLFHAIAQHNIIEEERDLFRLWEQIGRR
jgi:hypothetical protein